MILYVNKSWFQIMHSWFNSIHDRHLRHGKLTNMSDHISSQSLLLCLRQSKGLSTRLHCISESHPLAWPLPQVQPPSPHVAFLQRLVLNSDYISSSLCVCVCVCVCVLRLSLLMFPADWLMFKQLHMFGESPVLYTFTGWWPVCRCDEQKTGYWCLRSASSISFLLHCIIS